MKRVPMDFDWPLGRVWKGFLNPYEGCDCPWCYDEDRRGSYGYVKEAQEYEKSWYGHYCGEYVPNPYRPDTCYCPTSKPYTMERWEYDFIVNHDGRLRKQFFGCEKKEDGTFGRSYRHWMIDGIVYKTNESFFEALKDFKQNVVPIRKR